MKVPSIIVVLLLLLLLLSSCRHSLARPYSVLQAYKQFMVLSQIKRELRDEHLTLKQKGEYISLAEQLAPKDPEVKLFKASYLKEGGRRDEAEIALVEAIRLAPTYTPALSAYGKTLIKAGREVEGKSFCNYAVKLNPIDSIARDCAGLAPVNIKALPTYGQ